MTTKRSERVIVIGGDAAGMSAASQAGRLRGDLEIIAFERGPHTSYSACGMPYYVAELVDTPEQLIARTPEQFHRQGIDARIHHEVKGIDLAERTVQVLDLANNRTLTEPFDQLVIATGASPIKPDIPGIDADGVHSLDILRDGIRLREAIERRKPRRAVIIGGGYIGVEMAEAFLLLGLEVTMIEQSDQVMRLLDAEMAALVARALVEQGVRLLLGERVESIITRDGEVVGVETDQRTLDADIVVLAIGIRPNSQMAGQAGLPLGTTGGIVVDERQKTPVDGVWAAGDCVESFHLVSRRWVHTALGTVANKQGRVCGTNLGGQYLRFPGVLGTAITKFGALEIARTGLNEPEAREAGFEFTTGEVEGTVKSGYYPDAGEITIKVLAERGSGRLIGAQIVGGLGAGKRIDVFATAIAAGMTASDFAFLDLSYAPPFSPTWDTPLIAARRAANAK